MFRPYSTSIPEELPEELCEMHLPGRELLPPGVVGPGVQEVRGARCRGERVQCVALCYTVCNVAETRPDL